MDEDHVIAAIDAVATTVAMVIRRILHKPTVLSGEVGLAFSA